MEFLAPKEARAPPYMEASSGPAAAPSTQSSCPRFGLWHRPGQVTPLCVPKGKVQLPAHWGAYGLSGEGFCPDRDLHWSTESLLPHPTRQAVGAWVSISTKVKSSAVINCINDL